MQDKLEPLFSATQALLYFFGSATQVNLLRKSIGVYKTRRSAEWLRAATEGPINGKIKALKIPTKSKICSASKIEKEKIGKAKIL